MFCSILNLFTVVDRLSLVMQLRMSFAITQSATIGTYLLLLNSENTLVIYSISSTPELLYQTNQFQYHSIKVYPLGLCFLIIDAHTNQLSQIDTDHSFELHNIAHLDFACRSLLSTIMADRAKLFILADDYSILAMWNVQERTIKCIPTLLDNKIKIREICVLETFLVFYDNNQRAHLWNIENEHIILTLDHHLCQTNINCLTLIEHTGNKWFFYDTKKDRLRVEIRLETSCDVLCFTEDGKYLFGISQKESLLLMYRDDDGQLLEKLLIENLSSHIQVSKDRLILNSNNELLLLSITGRDSSSLKR
jgi:WD40 repeat protein